MDLFIIELICWGGLLFFFWALKDGLNRVEAEIESVGILPRKNVLQDRKPARFSNPDSAREPIGTYSDQPIYRYVVIEGRTYQFDRVLPPGTAEYLSDEERYIAPGLVYLENEVSTHPLPQTRS